MKQKAFECEIRFLDGRTVYRALVQGFDHSGALDNFIKSLPTSMGIALDIDISIREIKEVSTTQS